LHAADGRVKRGCGAASGPTRAESELGLVSAAGDSGVAQKGKTRDIFKELDERAVMLILSRAYHSCVASLEAHVGIAAPRWRLLYLLHLYGQCTQKALTQMIKIDPGSITRQLKILEKEALVARESDPEDNRLTRVMLSSSGVATVRAGLKRRRQFLMKMLHGLERDEIVNLLQALERIDKNLQDDGPASDRPADSPGSAKAKR
jgi:DNA-binding MarR family transcriptional regulator